MTSRAIRHYLAAHDMVDSGFYTEWFLTTLSTVDGIIVSFNLLPRWPYHPGRKPHRVNARLLLDCSNGWSWDHEDDELIGRPSLIVVPRRDLAELIFCDVKIARFTAGPGATIGHPDIYAQAEPDQSSWVFDTSGLFVQARAIYIRRVPRPDPLDLGPDTFIPVDDALLATQLDGSWRLCEHCVSAWECPPGPEFAFCPACGELTVLMNTETA